MNMIHGLSLIREIEHFLQKPKQKLFSSKVTRVPHALLEALSSYASYIAHLSGLVYR